MSPIQAAKASHDEDSQSTFEQDLVWHLHNAYVWSGKDAFIMGRPMPKSKVKEEAASRTTYSLAESDTWFVWRGAGKFALKRFLEVAPFKLPYVAWHRRGDKLKIYTWEDYEKKVNKYGNKS
tara:strand:- start:113 stop:478 length:366 start_codon:yes stop_codon:yes gene_type:complete